MVRMRWRGWCDAACMGERGDDGRGESAVEVFRVRRSPCDLVISFKCTSARHW